MSKIDFSQIENMLNSSSDFSLSETQYEKLTGRKMPKDNSYLIQKSALSKFCRKYGIKDYCTRKSNQF